MKTGPANSQLVKEAKGLLAKGVYLPEDLFDRLKHHRVHYSRIRAAIHEAKVR